MLNTPGDHAVMHSGLPREKSSGPALRLWTDVLTLLRQSAVGTGLHTQVGQHLVEVAVWHPRLWMDRNCQQPVCLRRHSQIPDAAGTDAVHWLRAKDVQEEAAVQEDSGDRYRRFRRAGAEVDGLTQLFLTPRKGNGAEDVYNALFAPAGIAMEKLMWKSPHDGILCFHVMRHATR